MADFEIIFIKEKFKLNHTTFIRVFVFYLKLCIAFTVKWVARAKTALCTTISNCHTVFQLVQHWTKIKAVSLLVPNLVCYHVGEYKV